MHQSLMPFFSVIIPAYNRAHLIGECLSSVLAQTERDFEVIVVDNNSSDNLVGALSAFLDPRIRMIHCVTPGPSAARNAGVREARGEYISLIDSDDLWAPDVLEVAREQIQCGANVVYLTASNFADGHAPVFDEVSAHPGNIQWLPDNSASIAIGIHGTGLIAAVKKEYLFGKDSFDEKLFVGEDFDWALRHADKGPVVILGDKTRLACRMHQVNICKRNELYMAGTADLIQRCLKGKYPLVKCHQVRCQTIKLLTGSITNIAIWGNPMAAISLYPNLVYLGFKWGQLNHVIIPQILRSWIMKRLNYIKSSCFWNFKK